MSGKFSEFGWHFLLERGIRISKIPDYEPFILGIEIWFVTYLGGPQEVHSGRSTGRFSSVDLKRFIEGTFAVPLSFKNI